MNKDRKNSDMSLGQRLRYCRDTAKLSQAELASQLGVTMRTIIKWEKEETIPKAPTIKEIAFITGFSYEWLDTGEGEPTAIINTAKAEGEEDMYRSKFEKAQEKIIRLMEEIDSLKDELQKKDMAHKKREANGR